MDDSVTPGPASAAAGVGADRAAGLFGDDAAQGGSELVAMSTLVGVEGAVAVGMLRRCNCGGGVMLCILPHKMLPSSKGWTKKLCNLISA